MAKPELQGSVGKARKPRTAPANATADQQTILDLLARVPSAEGGKREAWKDGAKPKAGTPPHCNPILADAIWDFQKFWLPKGGVKGDDGVVDKGGSTWNKLLELTEPAFPLPDANGIAIRQENPANLTAAHKVTNMVIVPLMAGNKFMEYPLTTRIHEFLFQIRKNGSVFWVGAAVPENTFDFTRAQVFFHPTVVNGGKVHAADSDYRNFKGGWSRTMQRYIALEGGQLAGARLMTMLVPFTTMGALSGSSALNMFATLPSETLNAVMTAIQNELNPAAPNSPVLNQVGVASFSSGITALRLFLQHTKSTGLVKEVIDFDSPFIRNEPKVLTHSSGAVSSCYTQVVKARPEPGWVNLPAANFSAIHTHPDAHARIGWMMYHTAMLASKIL